MGLSAYAALQHAAGHCVSGSDRSESALLADLRAQGMNISLDQSGAALARDTDILVYSEAIPTNAPERQRARMLRIPERSYPEALGDFVHGSQVIAVCGTHGKSSTTTMTALLLIDAGRDPTVVVGTKVPTLGGRNWRRGESDLFVLEACEYRRAFHHYDPAIVLMPTCDGDHFDCYRDIAEYRNAFVTFIRRLPESGMLITHMGDAHCRSVAEAAGRRVVNADVFALPHLRVPGQHMRRNAQLVLALARELAIPEEVARTSLAAFPGTWRRMEVKGEREDGVTVVDDYGHHPTEIRATLSAMREAYPGRRIVCVFQPHTHHRTRALYQDFTRAFVDADVVVISNVYVARADIESDAIDLPRFVTDIARESCKDAMLGGSLTEAQRLLEHTVLRQNDVFLCMGAGDITDLACAMVIGHPQRDCFTR